MTSPEIAAELRLPRPTKPEWWTLGALTAAFVLLVTFWAFFTPPHDAPDEPIHLNSAIRLAEGGGWPDPGDAEMDRMVLQSRAEAALPASERSTFAELRETHPGYHGVDQMTQHPPLYYAYVAVVLNAIDFMNVRSDIALTVARLAGVVLMIPLPFFAWDSVRRITRSAKAGILAAASLFAVPQLAHIAGSVSNDGMTILFSSAVIWLGVRAMTGDTRWRITVGMGIALALALLVKGTAVPMVAFAAVVLLIWPQELSFRSRMLRAATAMAVGLAGGWWWLRNLLVYGSLQPPGLVYPDAPWPEGSGPSMLWFADQAWGRLSLSFWGNFGWLSHPLPVFLTNTLTVVCLFVIVAFAFRGREDRGKMFALAALPLFFMVGLLTQTWPNYVRTQLPAGLQGRYFFVVLIALIVLSAVAWRNFIEPRNRVRVGIGLVVAFAAMAVLGLAVEYRAVYHGLGDWLARSPAGVAGTIVLTLLTAAVCAWAVVQSIRFIRARPAAVTAS
jgi:4-amino-4-deoxy-L-arabinose transferase-like glycosyltransferase